VESSRGSTFYLCLLSTTNPAFSKYPRLPVMQCPGFERIEEGLRDNQQS